MFRNIIASLGLFLAIAFSPIVSATIISSFEAGAELTVSANLDILDFETFIDDSELTENGSGSGNVSGSGDDLFDLLLDDAAFLSAFANGDVTGSPGDVEGLYLSSGEFIIENSSNSTLSGEIMFDLALVASIFTDSIEEAALAFSSIVIGFEKYDANGGTLDDSIFVDELLEFDSSFEGVGAFGGEPESIAYATSSTFSLEAGESIFYFMELDASGFANTARAPITSVPEPSTILMFVLALVWLSIGRN
jgi:hypothetical protein